MKYLVAILIALLTVALGMGSSDCSFSELWQWICGNGLSEENRAIIFEIRMPRLIGAVFVGGMLAAGGCTAQNIFRNELASPHVLGVVNFAALGAVCGLFISSSLIMPLSVLFGVASLMLLWLPGSLRNWDSSTLILCGIAINAFAAAMTSAMLYLADERLNSVVFWLMGGFWRMSWGDLWIVVPAAVFAWILLFRMADEMDMLLLGDRTAALAGVSIKRVKPLALLMIAVMTAAAVSVSGVIGFVGLAVPHMTRMFVGATFRRLLPAAVLLGGILLLLADTIARSVAPPHEIPVGIITALCGGPFFFWLLLKNGGAKHD